MRQALAQAAVVRTYALALARYLQPFNANVVRADGPVEWSLVPAEAPRRDDGRVHIVYATSRQQDRIGAVLVQPLTRVLAEHANIDVTICGPRFRELEGHQRVRFREFVRDYDPYFEDFARAGFDIGLAPMPDALFYQCKTATKFREYAACRVAGIYSDVETYRDCVSDGVTGLLVAPGDAGWVSGMDRLIRDAALRGRIQDEASACARERYAAARVDGDWLSHLEDARQHGRVSAVVVSAPLRGAGSDREPASGASPLAPAAGVITQTLRYARACRRCCGLAA